MTVGHIFHLDDLLTQDDVGAILMYIHIQLLTFVQLLMHVKLWLVGTCRHILCSVYSG